MSELIDPAKLLQPQRKIMGISAILLPYHAEGGVDWKGFDAHLRRTFDAGLVPAVNMDTGYGNLIDDAVREEVLLRSHRIADGQSFVAGVFVGDHPGQPLAETHIGLELSRFSGMVAYQFSFNPMD